MIKLTIQMLKDFKPCYCPTRYLSDDWEGTLVDILKIEEIPELDRIWVARHAMNDKGNRLFAVYCAREALKLVPDPDPRSVTACDVAEKFANGDATKEELSEARKMAYAAYGAVAGGAAYAAAAAAAFAARAAAYNAFDAAACVAADAAVYDAYAAAAAIDKARQDQINWLIEYQS